LENILANLKMRQANGVADGHANSAAKAGGSAPQAAKKATNDANSAAKAGGSAPQAAKKATNDANSAAKDGGAEVLTKNRKRQTERQLKRRRPKLVTNSCDDSDSENGDASWTYEEGEYDKRLGSNDQRDKEGNLTLQGIFDTLFGTLFQRAIQKSEGLKELTSIENEFIDYEKVVNYIIDDADDEGKVRELSIIWCCDIDDPNFPNFRAEVYWNKFKGSKERVTDLKEFMTTKLREIMHTNFENTEVNDLIYDEDVYDCISGYSKDSKTIDLGVNRAMILEMYLAVKNEDMSKDGKNDGLAEIKAKIDARSLPDTRENTESRIRKAAQSDIHACRPCMTNKLEELNRIPLRVGLDYCSIGVYQMTMDPTTGEKNLREVYRTHDYCLQARYTSNPMDHAGNKTEHLLELSVKRHLQQKEITAPFEDFDIVTIDNMDTDDRKKIMSYIKRDDVQQQCRAWFIRRPVKDIKTPALEDDEVTQKITKQGKPVWKYRVYIEEDKTQMGEQRPMHTFAVRKSVVDTPVNDYCLRVEHPCQGDNSDVSSDVSSCSDSEGYDPENYASEDEDSGSENGGPNAEAGANDEGTSDKSSSEDDSDNEVYDSDVDDDEPLQGRKAVGFSRRTRRKI